MEKVLEKWRNYVKVKAYDEDEGLSAEEDRAARIERGRLLNESK